jgi:hypothetical protein
VPLELLAAFGAYFGRSSPALERIQEALRT